VPESGYALTRRSRWRALRRHSWEAATGRGGKPHRPGTRPPLLDTVDSTPLDEVREGGVPVRRADQGHVGASGAGRGVHSNSC
jgi:hypothetical protein